MTAPDDRPWLCPRDETCESLGPSHDHAAGYFRGCRSGSATEAYRLYKKRRREGRQPDAYVDALGTRRRLQALMALGWRQSDIAERSGLPMKALDRYLRIQQVSRPTAAAVDAVFRALCMERGPSARTVRYASRAGWAPPLAWDNIDNPLERPKYGHAEVAKRREHIDHTETVARLTANGLSAETIADRIGITTRTVQRYRARIAERQAA